MRTLAILLLLSSSALAQTSWCSGELLEDPGPRTAMARRAGISTSVECRSLRRRLILKLGDPDSCCPRHHRDSHRKNVRRSNGIWEFCSDTEHARMSQCLRRLV
jgi:hypothetical protein